MKTAEEWRREIVDYECTHFDGSYDKVIRAIQLDAVKEGMWRAAEVCARLILGTSCPSVEFDEAIDQIRIDAFKSGLIRAATLTQKAKNSGNAYNAIMELATNLTEKDL